MPNRTLKREVKVFLDSHASLRALLRLGPLVRLLRRAAGVNRLSDAYDGIFDTVECGSAVVHAPGHHGTFEIDCRSHVLKQLLCEKSYEPEVAEVIAQQFGGAADAVDPAWPPFDVEIIMECGDLKRTGVAGLGRAFIVNIDHHLGNTMYGDLNWFDSSASACGELVFELIKELGVPLTFEIATHIYLAILTDTGSFHHSNITPRTFDICRQTVEAGVNPAAMARRVFDSNSFGKLKLIGALLDSMELVDEGRLAVLYMDDGMLEACGCTHNDTEGLINLPLTAREIQAVVFFKALEPDQVRVSMRSKYDVDVRSVATRYGGGGHAVVGAVSYKPEEVEEARAAFPEVIEQWLTRLSPRAELVSWSTSDPVAAVRIVLSGKAPWSLSDPILAYR